jgi:hypothetical protein
MARPADTLRPAWKVYYELVLLHRDIETALRVLRKDLATGARDAVLDGDELPKAFWKDHRVGLHPDGYSCFAEREGGGEIDGRLLISDPRPEPTPIEIVSWPTKLWRGLFGKKVDGAPTPAPGAASREPRSMQEWFTTALEDIPQKDGEKDVAYLRRLRKATPEQFRKDWSPKTYSNRLYDLRKRLEN